jgi:hypothetical protein
MDQYDNEAIWAYYQQRREVPNRHLCHFAREIIPPLNSRSWHKVLLRAYIQLLEAADERNYRAKIAIKLIEERMAIIRCQLLFRRRTGPMDMSEHFMRKILELECLKAMARTKMWEEQIKILKEIIEELSEYGDEQEFGDELADDDVENLRLLYRLSANI